MLSNDEILDDIACELGRHITNYRICLLQNEKMTKEIEDLNERVNNLTLRLAKEIEIKEELAEQLRTKKIKKTKDG